MVSVFLTNIVVLHAGTSPALSQATLTAMLVVLGIILVGMGFGLFSKNKEGLLQHRWSMTVAVAIALAAIIFVMLPSTYTYYIDPDVEFLSGLSITTIIHGAVGIFAISIGLIYAFGDLPKKVKSWMRWAALLWIASIVLGVILFLQMMEILQFGMMMTLG